MSRPTIAIYGAIDRFNYGDLLFPLILGRALQSAGYRQKLRAVGLRESDLSRYGAAPTQPVGWLAEPGNLPDGSTVIVAGGETLAAGWGRLHSHLLPEKWGDPIYSLMSRFLRDASLDRLGRKRAGVPWSIPFCPEPGHFANEVQVVFNAVGGSGLPSRPPAWQSEVSRALRSASYASVRDRATFDAVGAEGSGCELHPDSAALVGEMFRRPYLRERCRSDVASLIASGEPYICFQLHRYFSGPKLRQFAAELDRLQLASGLRVILLPLGRAAGHSDPVALDRVRAAMTAPATMPHDLSVIDIMALLAHCTAYTGTSLHGLITAMSYGRPYAMIGKNPKCLAFLRDWAPRQYREPLKAKQFSPGILDRLELPRQILIEGASKLQAAAREGLDRVVSATLAAHTATGLRRTGVRGAAAPPPANPEILAS